LLSEVIAPVSPARKAGRILSLTAPVQFAKNVVYLLEKSEGQYRKYIKALRVNKY